MQYKKLNIFTGWAIFLVAAIVYLLTIEPTASFWDCGEFIASAYKLEVGHPPGAPFFMLLGRIFTMFAPAENIATSVNVLSALCSAGTILFLFWSITAFAKKMVKKSVEDFSMAETIAVLGSGVVGALAYTFSDSFWFSAVEGEVYAMSSLFTAVVFWGILKYDEQAHEKHSTRWILFIAYLMGLSIGVHLLNLLAVPAIAFVYYFRHFETTRKGIIYTFLISVVILGLLQGVIIPGTFKVAGWFELLFVNSFGLPFFSGLAFYIVLLVVGVVVGVIYTIKKNKPMWNTVIMSFAMIMIGYSTFAMILIRSNANPPMDENNPEDVFSLISYLNREQYGDRPLLYGQYWMAPLDPAQPKVDGKPVRMKAYVVVKGDQEVISYRSEYDAKQYLLKNANQNLEIDTRYIISDDKKNSEYKYDPNFCSILPRMYSPQQNHINAYKDWSGFVGKPVRSGGKVLNKPTMVENGRFFFSYQLNWMYWRYFFWNFAGRQNDIQGHGNTIHGNWLTGVDIIDAERLGNQDELPAFIESNKGYNKYYLLPFILGIIGLVFHFIKDIRQWSVVGMLFFLTGIAIVIYLNQYPYQPRERDYAFVGSFYAFAIWIGLGVFALFDMARNCTFKHLQKIAMPGAIVGAVLFLFEMLGDSDHSLSFGVFYILILGLVLIVGLIALFQALKNEKSVAIVSVVIALAIPCIMASENWDDHSRADRTTGVDFAKNYLDSCEPNAILFTNGDNDTFPLWYAQEVEGYRTDVRVVNLSLLNTDWYIDQMKRKAYDSDPVPFSMEEPHYRQGTRDIVLLDDTKNKQGRFVNLKQAINFVKNDRNKVPVSTSEKLQYIPSKTFSIPVNKQKVLANGTVAKENAGQIVSEITWTLNKNYVLKNTLLALDLLANNDWERPIYFAVTTGSDAYMGLEEYFQLEGLAYRLVPIRTPRNTNPGVSGRIARDIMYENMMNKFSWGGMDTEDIYMDENNLRMTTNLRLQFSNLADEFIRTGDNAKAVEVLDKCLAAMPEKNVPYTQIMMPIIESYYRAGDNEKAKIVAQKLFDIEEQSLNYYFSLAPEYLAPLSREIQIANAVSDRIIGVSRAAGENEFAADLDQRFKAIQNKMQKPSQKISF